MALTCRIARPGTMIAVLKTGEMITYNTETVIQISLIGAGKFLTVTITEAITANLITRRLSNRKPLKGIVETYLNGTEVLNGQTPNNRLTIFEENVVMFSTGMKTGRRPTPREIYNLMKEGLKEER